jgi:hypothetical protein
MDPGFRRESESRSCQFSISVWILAQPLRAARGQALVPGIYGKRQGVCRVSCMPTDLVRGLKAHGSNLAKTNEVNLPFGSDR